MWSFVTIMRNCGFNYFVVAKPVNVSLCLLYMWHNCISVNYTSIITHAVPGF